MNSFRPNPETIAAMEAARRGEFEGQGSIDDLFSDHYAKQPNAETLEAMDELRRGGGKSFTSVEALMADLEE